MIKVREMVDKTKRNKNHRRLRIAALIVSMAAALAAAGCSPIGPAAVKRDRLHYSTAVADSWKEQLLLNIVKTRYGDAPLFLDITSVVSGYTMESQVGAGFEYHPDDPEDFLTAGGQVTYTDRPTLSYAPMSGEKFARSLMAPVPVDVLLFVLQQQVPADFILGLTLESLEGHQNGITYSVGLNRRGFKPADPSFVKVLKILTELQQARAISFERVQTSAHTDLQLSFVRVRGGGQDTSAREKELRSLLDIPESAEKISMIYGFRAEEPDIVAVRTRSLLQIMAILGAGVEVQEEHLGDGSALKTESLPEVVDFTVHSGREKSPDAFVAVPYEGIWFWIDRRDYETKSTLTALTVLFNFLEGGGRSVSPVMTIPVQ